jgi:outer membrane biosynthesis protein TonB
MSFEPSAPEETEFQIPTEEPAPVTEAESPIEESAPEQPIIEQPDSQPQETPITPAPQTATETLLCNIQKVAGAQTATLNGTVLTVTYTPKTNHNEITEMQTQIAILLSQAGLPISYINYQKAQ